MTEWSPTRREFLGTVGVGGTPIASWGNVTDAVPDRPFVPAADERWSHDLGDDAVYPFGPVDGTLYVRTEGAVHAVATDGTRRWRFDVDGNYPVVQVGRTSFGAASRVAYVSDDRRVYALDPEDGEVRWRYEDARRPALRSAIPGLAVVFDDDRLGEDDALVGLSATDGSERWRVTLDGRLWLEPHLDGRTFFAGTDEGSFYALDLEDGEIRWRAEPFADETTSNDPAQLIAVGSTADLVFAWRSEAGTLLALEPADGSERWRLDTDSEEYVFPGTVREETVYLRNESSLRALSAADGRERWRFDAESLLGLPQVVGETAYVGNRDGIWALSTDDGRERWRSEIGTVPTGVTDDALVCMGFGTRIHGVSAADGRLRWQYDAGEQFALPPVVHEDAAYFGTRSGTVAAVSDPGPTPVSDALRTVASPASLAVGGLLGGALAAGAYRRRRGSRAKDASSTSEESAVGDEPATAEDFELVEPLAETDHAEVHEARAPDGTRVALKRLAPGELSPETFTAAVETWADLDVPGVLDVRAWGLDPVPWVATEYATSGHLGAKAPNLTTEERARVVAKAAETVHRAHREGVTHGRLVPGNVLFSTDGVRVGDWRLAAELRDPPEEFRPPEWDSGSDADSEDADPAADPEAADTYQLAAMARELLAGDEHGAEGDHDVESEHDAEELTDVLARALAADSADRYDSALKFADALRWAVRE